MRMRPNFTLALLFAFLVAGQARAEQLGANSITIENPWARATPSGAKTGAVYMTVIDNGDSADRLLGATTPVADKVQFHKETEENGVSRMRELPGVEMTPGAKVIFAPGALHVMMVGLKHPLKEGQTFPLTLNFEKAGKIAVTVPVAKVGAMEHQDMGAMEPANGGATKK